MKTLAALFFAILPYLDISGIVALAWLSLSGVVNGFLDKHIPHDDEGWAAYFATRPRLFGVVNFFRTAGLSPQGVVRSIRAIFAKTMPKPLRIALETMTARWAANEQIDIKPELDALRAKYDYEKAIKQEEIDALKRVIAAMSGSGPALLLFFAAGLLSLGTGCAGNSGDFVRGAERFFRVAPPAAQQAYALSLATCRRIFDESHPTQEDFDDMMSCSRGVQDTWGPFWEALEAVDGACAALPAGFCKQPTDVEGVQ